MTHYPPNPTARLPPAHAVREPDPYEQQIANHAESWRRLAERQSGMTPAAVAELAIRAACFTLRHRCNDLAFPMPLAAGSRHQDELFRLCNHGPEFGMLLQIEPKGMLLQVRHGDDVIGLIPREHVSWMRPLLKLGADLRLVSISGCDTESDPLEATVMLTRVGRAVEKLHVATGKRGDRVSKVAEPAASTQSAFRLRRDENGIARTNVRNTYPESLQGHEWGYGGSGPAELALSILWHFLSEEEAWDLHGAFKDDVLDPMPWEGGEISHDQVRQWIASEKERRVCC